MIEANILFMDFILCDFTIKANQFKASTAAWADFKGAHISAQ
jgi:hypothetical protein